MSRIIVWCIGLLIGGLLVVQAPPAAAAEIGGVRCPKVVWASEPLRPENANVVGSVASTYNGCLVKRGWSATAVRVMKDRQWQLRNELEGICVGEDCHTYYLSGVRKGHYKGDRVTFFKYRFTWNYSG